MSWAQLLALLKKEHTRLSPFFRSQLEQELLDLVTRYLRPLRGEGPP